MKRIICFIGLSLLLFSCSRKVIYLSSWGTVVGIKEEYIEVRFNCENVRRPDCDAIARFDRYKFGDSVSLFQRVEICN